MNEIVHAQTAHGRGIKIIDVWVCKLRNKIGAECIETVWGSGYRLTAQGIEVVKSVLSTEQRRSA